MSRAGANVIWTILVLIMVTLAYFSLAGDSLTFDEAAHIPAGFSYLDKRDMRLNPEHPPLIKDVAGLPLVLMRPGAPYSQQAWAQDINGQWIFGHDFMFESGNDPDELMAAARSMMLIFLALIALYLFKWTRVRYGILPALLVTVLFTFSPTFLAQGRYVTTDVGATFGFLFSFYYFAEWVNKRRTRDIVYAGLAFGVAQLIKFSLIIIAPLFVGFVLLFWFTKDRWKLKPLVRSLSGLIAIFLIGLALIYPVYYFHTVGYPQEEQLRQAEAILGTGDVGPVEGAVIAMTKQPVLRPYGQYLLGLSMVIFRGTGGNTTYFNEEVAAKAWKEYFPVVFALKEPVSLLILYLGALIIGLTMMVQKLRPRNISKWVDTHIDETIWIGFVAFYWLISIFGNLNIGLRHVLPTFPFMYMLLAWAVREPFKRGVIARLSGTVLVGGLLIWYVTSSILSYPHYLQYFNEIAGGPEEGYRYTVDSNLDWGQDLKRLAAYVEENNIESIKLAYFGGDDPALRLGSAYQPFNASEPGQTGWMAISATLLMGGCAEPAHGFDQTTHHHEWLCAMEPVEKIGNSIFVYYVPET